jgi:hypothetical protein
MRHFFLSSGFALPIRREDVARSGRRQDFRNLLSNIAYQANITELNNIA